MNTHFKAFSLILLTISIFFSNLNAQINWKEVKQAFVTMLPNNIHLRYGIHDQARFDTTLSNLKNYRVINQFNIDTSLNFQSIKLELNQIDIRTKVKIIFKDGTEELLFFNKFGRFKFRDTVYNGSLKLMSFFREANSVDSFPLQSCTQSAHSYHCETVYQPDKKGYFFKVYTDSILVDSAGILSNPLWFSTSFQNDEFYMIQGFSNIHSSTIQYILTAHKISTTGLKLIDEYRNHFFSKKGRLLSLQMDKILIFEKNGDKEKLIETVPIEKIFEEKDWTRNAIEAILNQ